MNHVKLIDPQELKRRMCDKCPARDGDECHCTDLDVIDGMRDAYPTAHWVLYNEERSMGILHFARCSACGGHHVRGSHIPKFCEDCGASMEEASVYEGH